MNEFVKLGNTIVTKPQGCDYSLESGKVYDLKWNRLEMAPNLTLNGNLNFPSKIYLTEKDDHFIKCVLNYFNTTNDNNVGVLLTGVKGTGKTVTAKLLAKHSDLPIIVVDNRFPAERLKEYFKRFKQNVCILMDEIEKNFHTEFMLDLLDGVQATCKKLFIATCNNTRDISEYFIDRCSRIRYLRNYTIEQNFAYLSVILDDLQIKNKEKVIEFCKNEIKLLSLDNMLAFVKEIKSQEDVTDDLNEIIEYMNIATNFKQKSLKEKNVDDNAKVITTNSTQEEIDAAIRTAEEEDYYDYNDWEVAL